MITLCAIVCFCLFMVLGIVFNISALIFGDILLAVTIAAIITCHQKK